MNHSDSLSEYKVVRLKTPDEAQQKQVKTSIGAGVSGDTTEQTKDALDEDKMGKYERTTLCARQY